jgi:methylase of polypeptide subunit release factors
VNKLPHDVQGVSARLECPACHSELRLTEHAATCSGCGAVYPKEDGIWRFMLPGREAHFTSFLNGYKRIRAEQGWGNPSRDYYRQLPRVEPNDPQAAIWKAREVHTSVFVKRVLAPLEAQCEWPLLILDLGAGNGWLSNLLAQRGHTVTAVDINVDVADGLGAWRYYANHFEPLQAEYDRLPLAPDQFDLIIFNASLHYSPDIATTITAALRTLKEDGILVIMDTPLYQDKSDGEAMRRERRVDYAADYGVASDVLSSKEYVTRYDLDHLSQSLSVTPKFVWPIQPMRQTWRNLKTALQNRRAAASFPLIIVSPYPQWSPNLMRRILRRIGEPCLKLKYHFVDQRRMRHTYVTRVSGYRLRVHPQVFDPRLYGTGEFLAQALSERWIPPGSRVLDLGTGSGIGALVAAQWASRVTATDINPAAVACARENFEQNSLNRIEVRCGDLFDTVANERFDVILFNPPFFHGIPQTPHETAFVSSDIAERFAAGLADHLTVNGVSLLVLSDRGCTSTFMRVLRVAGFNVETIAQKVMLTECLSLYRVTAARPGLATQDERCATPIGVLEPAI